MQPALDICDALNGSKRVYSQYEFGVAGVTLLITVINSSYVYLKFTLETEVKHKRYDEN